VEGLRVGGVAGEGVHLVETAVEGVVIAGAEVVLFEGGVIILARVKQVRLRRAAVADHDAVAITKKAPGPRETRREGSRTLFSCRYYRSTGGLSRCHHRCIQWCGR
jgi:hypothetical protein